MASSRYPVPAGRVRVEDEVKRSRFITTLDRARDADSARVLVDEMRAVYADASHNCWAFLVGAPGTTGTVGMSDDGEPHGTAGRPMLNVLAHSELGDVAVVVTRYFGGTKLGKGGLVRAYSSGVQHALGAVDVVDKVERTSIIVRLDYTFVEQVKRLLPDHEAEVTDEKFGAEATFGLRVPTEQVEGLVETLQNLTRGKAVVIRGS